MMKQWSRSEAEMVIKGGIAAKLYFDKGCYVNTSYALVFKNFTRNTCVEIQVQ